MKVRVLGCSGAIAKDCRTTSFLIDGDLLVDAGTGVGDLTLDEMAGIDDVLLTHSHLDHVAALPLMVDAIASQLHRAAPRACPARHHRGAEGARLQQRDLAGLQPHPQRRGALRHLPRDPGRPDAGARRQARSRCCRPCTPCRPAATRSRAGRGCWVFTGDTERNPAFWRRINQLDVAVLVIETAFSNRETGPGPAQPAPVAARAGRGTGLHRPGQALPDLHHPHQAGRDRADHDRDPAVRPDAAVRAERRRTTSAGCAPARSSSCERRQHCAGDPMSAVLAEQGFAGVLRLAAAAARQARRLLRGAVLPPAAAGHHPHPRDREHRPDHAGGRARTSASCSTRTG